jgi:hypothetical protein
MEALALLEDKKNIKVIYKQGLIVLVFLCIDLNE